MITLNRLISRIEAKDSDNLVELSNQAPFKEALVCTEHQYEKIIPEVSWLWEERTLSGALSPRQMLLRQFRTAYRREN